MCEIAERYQRYKEEYKASCRVSYRVCKIAHMSVCVSMDRWTHKCKVMLTKKLTVIGPERCDSE